MLRKIVVRRRKVVSTMLSAVTIASLKSEGISAPAVISKASSTESEPLTPTKDNKFLENANIKSWIEVTGNGIYEWRYGDYSAQIDGQFFIKSRFYKSETGAWCRILSYDFFKKEITLVPDSGVFFVRSAQQFRYIVGDPSIIYRLVSWHGKEASLSSDQTDQDSGGGIFLWRSGNDNGRAEMSIPDSRGTGRFVRVGYDQVTPEMFGAYSDLSTDDTDAIQDAIDLATTLDMPCVLRSAYRTTRSIRVTCKCLVTCGTEITKDLDDSEVIRFIGKTGGAPGEFRVHIGFLHARQSSKPPTSFLNAHAFVFQSVVNCALESLKAGNCAYAFVNDAKSVGIGRFWGNRISWMLARGCVQGFMSMPFNGSGAHTENSFGIVYFNGKEENNDKILPKHDFPIFINNGEGWCFDCLNLEWVDLAESSGSLIQLRNDTTLIVKAFHPEGLQKLTGGEMSIFRVVNNGEVRTNIFITNFHINNWYQTQGKIFLLSSNKLATGKMKVDGFSGNRKSNNILNVGYYDNYGSMIIELFGLEHKSSPI